MKTKRKHHIVISPQRLQYPFYDFQPVLWNPRKKENDDPADWIFSSKRDHGIRGTYRLHNPKDEINDNRRFLDKVLVAYQIGRKRYDIFTIRDLFEVTYPYEPRAEGNIMGDTAERISRRITKYFLKHFSRVGRTGGIFDNSFNPQDRDDFIVANTDRYVLKIDKYPNLVILKKTGKGKYGYENIKELDGLFDYRYAKKRHILVLESKIDKINVDCDDLITNLFVPLRQFFPEATFSYILFSDTESIYVRKGFHRQRQLKHTPVQIYKRLEKEGIGILFFTFNESQHDFVRIKDHLITQYRSITRMGVTLYGKMVISDKQIMLFDEGETPHLKLIKDRKYGMWKEVKLTHKSRKNTME
ncbi:MAG: hypothetical protein ACOC41_03180 [Chitinivibrionales bacterium]